MAKKPAAKPSTPTYPVNPALEAAVIAHAEEDTPRLVYADWLDENGDPDRAAYIRNECALYDKNPADVDYSDLVERKAHLCELMHDRWWRFAPQLPDCLQFFSDPGAQSQDDERTPNKRGFPYFVGARYFHDDKTDRNLRDVLGDLVKTTTIRGLEIDSREPAALRSVMADPVAGHFSALSITNQDPDATGSGGTIPILLASPMCANLRCLDISNVVTPTDAGFLANAKSFHRLRRLGGGLHCDAAPMKRLMSSAWFGELSRVSLYLGAGAVPAAIQGLARLPNLHTLELSGVPAEGFPAFPKSNAFQLLGRLGIARSALHGTGVTSLMKAKLPNLVALELQECGLTDSDVEQIARSALFGRLRAFSCWEPIGNKSLLAIAASTCAPHLRRLNVVIRKVGTKALGAIAQHLTDLTSLRLIDREGATATRDVTWFLERLTLPRLTFLNLSMKLDDRAVLTLGRNTALTTLTALDVSSSVPLSSTAVVSLLESPNLQRLQRLAVTSEVESELDVPKLRRLLSDRKVMPELRQLDLCRASHTLGGISRALRIQDTLKSARPGLDVR